MPFPVSPGMPVVCSQKPAPALPVFEKQARVYKKMPAACL